MSLVERSGLAAELLDAPTRSRDVARATRELSRVAAWSMLQDDPTHAPYGWAIASSMPQGVLGIADCCADPRDAIAVAATYVLGFRATQGTVALDPEWLPERPRRPTRPPRSEDRRAKQRRPSGTRRITRSPTSSRRWRPARPSNPDAHLAKLHPRLLRRRSGGQGRAETPPRRRRLPLRLVVARADRRRPARPVTSAAAVARGIPLLARECPCRVPIWTFR